MLLGQTRETPPDERSYDFGEERFNPQMIPQGKEMKLQALLPAMFLSDQQHFEVLQQKAAYLWVCGRVRYQDTYGEETHETSFCFLYETIMNRRFEPYWTPAGADNLNTAT